MNIKRFCYLKGKEYLEKEIAKLEKKRDKASNQLFGADPLSGSTTQRQRAMMRVRLSSLCQEIDQKKGYLEQINELLAE